MKAVSDKKMAKAIKRIQDRFAAAAGESVATYEIETLEDFHAALIEQAEQMAPGNERLVYFRDNEPALFDYGYGIAKLYHHESYEQGASAFVYVDIFSDDTRRALNVVKSDLDGTWSCTDMVRFMTSADCYTKQETHNAITGYGYTKGMVREFEISAPSYSEIYGADRWYFDGNEAKIYTIMVTDGTDNYTLTVDYRQLAAPATPNNETPTMTENYFKVPTFHETNGAGFIQVMVQPVRKSNGEKSVYFWITDDSSGGDILSICGYY